VAFGTLTQFGLLNVGELSPVRIKYYLV